jgi:hypothetical protein
MRITLEKTINCSAYAPSIEKYMNKKMLLLLEYDDNEAKLKKKMTCKTNYNWKMHAFRKLLPLPFIIHDTSNHCCIN